MRDKETRYICREKNQGDGGSPCDLLISYLFVLISIFLSRSSVKKCQYEDEKDGNKPRCSLYEHGQISSFNLTLSQSNTRYQGVGAGY